jgi:hypothetical protein
MAGVPCMEIAFWGPVYDKLYHTTGDVPSVLSRASIQANMRFNALGVLRFDSAGIVRYDLEENLNVARAGMANILKKDATVFAAGHADMSVLEKGMTDYRAVLKAKAAILNAKTVTPQEAARVNGLQMAAAKALLPNLFDWDSSGIPGWTGAFSFDTYANDLATLDKAIAALRAGKRQTCAARLAAVTTMAWGQYVGGEAYGTVLEHIAYNPHLLWGYGFIPRLTDVHTEYMSLKARAGGDAMSDAEILASLRTKHDALYGAVTAAAVKAGTAFSAAAEVLQGL